MTDINRDKSKTSKYRTKKVDNRGNESLNTNSHTNSHTSSHSNTNSNSTNTRQKSYKDSSNTYSANKFSDKAQNKSDNKPDNKKENKSENKSDNKPENKTEAVAQIVESAIVDLPKAIQDFDDMNFLPNEILTSIYDYGFKYPSPVQSRSIHIINAGHDMIVQSESGTGKTGAFVIGALSVIEPEKIHPQIIIIANTHPLANQISLVVERLSVKLGIKVCLCVGGGKMRPDQNVKIAKRSHVLVGTPGRLKDIALKNAFKPQDIKIIIMDEADELLKDDFCNDVRDIVGQVSKDTQICTFSATYTERSYNLAKNTLMNDPYEVVIEQEQLSTDRIQQYKIIVDPGQQNRSYRNHRRQREDTERIKLEVLKELANNLTINQAIIFTNHKNSAYMIRDELMRIGFAATGIVTSESDSVTREQVLCQFRLCQIKFLISTDLISRGIDIDDLRCVINFDFPKSSESYIHRIGRSGRYGGHGIAINLITYDDAYLLTQLKTEYGIIIDDMPILDDVNRILTGFESPDGKASSSQNYKAVTTQNFKIGSTNSIVMINNTHQ